MYSKLSAGRVGGGCLRELDDRDKEPPPSKAEAAPNEDVAVSLRSRSRSGRTSGCWVGRREADSFDWPSIKARQNDWQ